MENIKKTWNTHTHTYIYIYIDAVGNNDMLVTFMAFL